MKHQLNKLAFIIDKAAKEATPIAQLSVASNFDLADAYNIQKLSINQRIERGEKLIGYKLGFTSKAKMEQMGVHEVIWGRLTDAMHLQNKGILDFRKFIHPRAEPEIAFKVSRRIDTVLTAENVLNYISGVAAAIEIIDSRYENFKFSLEDVVADNCSSSAYIIGHWHSPDTSISGLDIALNINGAVRKTGNSNAILGNPIASMIEMSRMALKYGESIEAGAIILAGAATSAEYIHPKDEIEAVFQGLGAVKLKVQ